MSDDIERCQEEERVGSSIGEGREQRLETLRNRLDRLTDDADRLDGKADQLESSAQSLPRNDWPGRTFYTKDIAEAREQAGRKRNEAEELRGKIDELEQKNAEEAARMSERRAGRSLGDESER